MTKKEYRKIMQEISERKFEHMFKSVTCEEEELEIMDAISLEDIHSILRKHVRKKRKTGRKIQINIK